MSSGIRMSSSGFMSDRAATWVDREREWSLLTNSWFLPSCPQSSIRASSGRQAQEHRARAVLQIGEREVGRGRAGDDAGRVQEMRMALRGREHARGFAIGLAEVVARPCAFCDLRRAAGKSRPWGVVTPTITRPVELLGRVAVTHVQGLPKGGSALCLYRVTNARL